jgi:hypothetical protein
MKTDWTFDARIMANPSPPPPTEQKAIDATTTPPTPLRCFTGALISGGIGTLLYFLTQSIIQSFANKPLPTGSATATNIAVAVRTLVVGMSTLGTAIFGITALGLIALGIQLLAQSTRSQDRDNKPES